MNLHISNLNPETTSEQLLDLFQAFGQARCSQIRTIANVSKDVMDSFAVVSMDDSVCAEKAMAALDNTMVLDKCIKVVGGL